MKRFLESVLGINVRCALGSRWPRLYRIAYSWCHDPHTAADLAQETMARALRSRDRLPSEQALDAWLFQIMRNCWRDQRRRHRPTTDVDELPLASDADPERTHYGAQVSARVQAAVADLSEDHRQVFTLVVIDGLTYEQVAQALEIPVGTVMSRLWRARQRLQDKLHDLAPLRELPSARLWSVK